MLTHINFRQNKPRHQGNTERSMQNYPASSWFLLRFPRDKPLRATVWADLHDTILWHATSSRQAYDMTYDCRSVLKHVLKCYDIFSDVHNNRKSCRGPVVGLSTKSYRVNRPFDFLSGMCEVRHTPRDVFDVNSSYFVGNHYTAGSTQTQQLRS